MSFLHNQIVTIGDKEPVHVNLPPFFDVILQVLPECIEFEDSMQNLSYRASTVDFGTGSTAQFMIKPKAIMNGELAVKAFTRKHYNAAVDFTFLSEGRYLSFWTSNMAMAFRPMCYVGPNFPDITTVDQLFDVDPNTGEDRLWFYALNWGQARVYNSSVRLIAIYTEGYRKCYWSVVTGIEYASDPRFIKVNIAHKLPPLRIADIDVITDYVYVRRNADEAQFNYITNEIVDIPLPYEEDPMHVYNPYTEQPKIYPVLPTTP